MIGSDVQPSRIAAPTFNVIQRRHRGGRALLKSGPWPAFHYAATGLKVIRPGSPALR
jgi:hypothetical protein